MHAAAATIDPDYPERAGDIAQAILGALAGENKAQIDLPTKEGVTPLYVACENGHLKVVELLVKHGADVKRKFKGWWTPLDAAQVMGHESIERFLKSQTSSSWTLWPW